MTESPPASAAALETTRIARAASIISLGNIASRVLGLVREVIKSSFFGAGALVDAFNVATIVPTMISDLLVGGMVNSALVPVFSDLAQRDREELWKLVSALLGWVAAGLGVFVALAWLGAEPIAALLNKSPDPGAVPVTARLLRITIPAVIFINLAAVLSALLYALRRFTLPAFTVAAYNAAMVLATLLLARRLSIDSMAWGLLAGSVIQLLIQLPGLRDARLLPRLDWRHPGLRRILLLYAPIALGLVVDILIARPITYGLATRTGVGGISWLNYATYLIQLPQGLVASAISFAILPTLSAFAAQARDGAEMGPFNDTLGRGLRLALLLILPAAVALFVLAQPVVALLYERQAFTPTDTLITARALRYYLLGLPFAAVDLLLVFAFYARQDTLRPSLIGVASQMIYLIAALLLVATPLGLFGLMLADAIKHMVHTLISAILLMRGGVSLRGQGLSTTSLRLTLASGLMVAATYSGLWVLLHWLPDAGLINRALIVALPAGLGGLTYLGLVRLLHIEEIDLILGAIRSRLPRRIRRGG